jgi:hypothetical protein
MSETRVLKFGALLEASDAEVSGNVLRAGTTRVQDGSSEFTSLIDTAIISASTRRDAPEFVCRLRWHRIL